MRFCLILVCIISLFLVRAKAEEEGLGDLFDKVKDKVKDKVESFADKIKDIGKEFTDKLPWGKLEDVGDALKYLKELVFPDQVWPDDVDHWVPLSDRLILGLDEDNEPLAIYDLSIPNPFSVKQIARATLGVVGVGDLNIRTIIKELEDLIDDVGLSGVPSVIKDGVDILDSIKDEFGKVTDDLKSGWTDDLEFKNKKRGIEELQAGNINFRNLDFKDMLSGSKFGKFEDALKEARDILKKVTGLDFGPNFLEQFELKKRSDGGYDIGMQVLDLFSEDNIHFCKVTDFKSPSLNKVFVLALKGTEILLGKAVRLLDAKVPPLGTILSVIVSKFFRMLDEQQSYYRHMLWEHLNNFEIERQVIKKLTKKYSGSKLETKTAEAFDDLFGEGYVRSPVGNSLISSSDRDKMATYLITRYPGLFGQIFSLLDEDDWEDEFDEDMGFVKTGYDEMKKRYTTVRKLGFWHTVYHKKGDEDNVSIVSNARALINVDSKRVGRTPLTAVYSGSTVDQLATRATRNGNELVWTVLKFNPDPIGEIILSAVYDFFVNFQMARDKGYEHRLASQLLWREYNHDEDWGRELEIIYENRVNPFLLFAKEEAELLELRWARWMPQCPSCNIQPGCSLDTTTKICCDVTC